MAIRSTSLKDSEGGLKPLTIFRLLPHRRKQQSFQEKNSNQPCFEFDAHFEGPENAGFVIIAAQHDYWQSLRINASYLLARLKTNSVKEAKYHNQQ